MDKTENREIPDKIRIGTRGSRLAQRQTDLLIQAVQKAFPDVVCEKVIIATRGDRIADRPLAEFGGKGVFVEEFERLIRAGELDYAVHSAKDMPMELAEGLSIVCVLPRADVRDVLITRKNCPIGSKKKALVGTGSLRRRAQLVRLYPHVQFCEMRGNIDTRLEKLRGGACDGIVLAAAGIERIGCDREEDLSYTYFAPEDVLPAGGQALIAVEGRNGENTGFWRMIGDADAALALDAERYVMRKLGAGCQEAVGVYADIFLPGQINGLEIPGCLMDKRVALPEKRIRLSLMAEREGRVQRVSGEAKLRDWRQLADELSG